MAVLLEFKEKFRRFYNKYDTYLVPALKFIVALVFIHYAECKHRIYGEAE